MQGKSPDHASIPLLLLPLRQVAAYERRAARALGGNDALIQSQRLSLGDLTSLFESLLVHGDGPLVAQGGWLGPARLCRLILLQARRLFHSAWRWMPRILILACSARLL